MIKVYSTAQKYVFLRMTGLSNIGRDLEVSRDIASNGTIWSQHKACLTTYNAHTKAEVNTITYDRTDLNSLLELRALQASPTFTGTVAAHALNVTTDFTCGTLTCQSLYGGAVAQIKTNVLSNPIITGSATVGDSFSISGDSHISGSRLEDKSKLINQQVNGFSSTYSYNTISGAAPTETGHILCGQSGG